MMGIDGRRRPRVMVGWCARCETGANERKEGAMAVAAERGRLVCRLR